MNNPTASELLHRAAKHLDDRAKTYDSVAGERSAGKTATAFNAITGNKLTSGDVYLLLTILKMVRSRQGAFKQDNYEDGAAYFALTGEADAADVGSADLQTMQKPAVKFSCASISRIRESLKDCAAGNSQCTMTDLDLACDMLDALVEFAPV
jgi:hypothetical protein